MAEGLENIIIPAGTTKALLAQSERQAQLMEEFIRVMRHNKEVDNPISGVEFKLALDNLQSALESNSEDLGNKIDELNAQMLSVNKALGTVYEELPQVNPLEIKIQNRGILLYNLRILKLVAQQAGLLSQNQLDTSKFLKQQVSQLPRDITLTQSQFDNLIDQRSSRKPKELPNLQPKTPLLKLERLGIDLPEEEIFPKSKRVKKRSIVEPIEQSTPMQDVSPLRTPEVSVKGLEMSQDILFNIWDNTDKVLNLLDKIEISLKQGQSLDEVESSLVDVPLSKSSSISEDLLFEIWDTTLKISESVQSREVDDSIPTPEPIPTTEELTLRDVIYAIYQAPQHIILPPIMEELQRDFEVQTAILQSLRKVEEQTKPAVADNTQSGVDTPRRRRGIFRRKKEEDDTDNRGKDAVDKKKEERKLQGEALWRGKVTKALGKIGIQGLILDKVLGVVGSLYKFLKDNFVPIAAVISSFIASLFSEESRENWRKFGESLWLTFQAGLGALFGFKYGEGSFWRQFGRALYLSLYDFGEWLIKRETTGLIRLTKWLHNAFKWVIDGLNYVGDLVLSRALEGLESLRIGLLDKLTEGWNYIDKLGGEFGIWLEESVDKLWERVSQFFIDRFNGISNGFKQVGNWFDTLGLRIRSLFSKEAKAELQAVRERQKAELDLRRADQAERKEERLKDGEVRRAERKERDTAINEALYKQAELNREERTKDRKEWLEDIKRRGDEERKANWERDRERTREQAAYFNKAMAWWGKTFDKWSDKRRDRLEAKLDKWVAETALTREQLQKEQAQAKRDMEISKAHFARMDENSVYRATQDRKDVLDRLPESWASGDPYIHELPNEEGEEVDIELAAEPEYDKEKEQAYIDSVIKKHTTVQKRSKFAKFFGAKDKEVIDWDAVNKELKPLGDNITLLSGASISGVLPAYLDEFKKAVDEFKELTGYSMQVNSAYRTQEEQERLRREGKEAATGISPHQVGIALDITPIKEGASAPFMYNKELHDTWLGIISKYNIFQPMDGTSGANKQNEPWHYEYDVGQGVAGDPNRPKVIADLYAGGVQSSQPDIFSSNLQADYSIGLGLRGGDKYQYWSKLFDLPKFSTSPEMKEFETKMQADNYTRSNLQIKPLIYALPAQEAPPQIDPNASKGDTYISSPSQTNNYLLNTDPNSKLN